MNTGYLNYLKNETTFNRASLQQAISSSKSYANKIIQQLLKSGKIARVGRNQYQVVTNNTKTIYQYEYSDYSKDIAKLIQENHPYLDFTVFELTQLNYFVDHLFGHNIIFLFVEDKLEDYVFQTLVTKYPGKILVHPDSETYNRYVQDGFIVILKLKSESPKGKPIKWHIRLEKLIVDLFVEKLFIKTISLGEYSTIIENIFDNYIIDENCLFRYARRRNAEQKIIDYIAKETTIKLRTKGKYGK